MSDAAAVAAISKVPPPVCCKARIVASELAGVTVPDTLPNVEAGRLSGAAVVSTAVLPATTGTPRTMPVPRPVVELGTDHHIDVAGGTALLDGRQGEVAITVNNSRLDHRRRCVPQRPGRLAPRQPHRSRTR
ncbi:hypothetical protein ACTMU2_11645 [Cupriavidus basilensis]